jgi:hypothetical protein
VGHVAKSAIAGCCFYSCRARARELFEKISYEEPMMFIHYELGMNT